MFQSVDARTDGRTPARLVYYKLFGSGALKNFGGGFRWMAGWVGRGVGLEGGPGGCERRIEVLGKLKKKKLGGGGCRVRGGGSGGGSGWRGVRVDMNNELKF